ncbi:hypothetical protein RV07_GL001973 [Enterococcus malodoratus]|nr:hypothetical protein RV07_GL001973 [Enterococcus malodoratus]
MNDYLLFFSLCMKRIIKLFYQAHTEKLKNVGTPSMMQSRVK